MKRKLKENAIVDVYLDHQNRKKYLGAFVLIKYIEHGLPYILQEDKNPALTVTFIDEKWLAEALTGSNGNYYPSGFRKQVNIRTVYKVGLTASGNTNLRDIDLDYEEIAVNDFLILKDYDTSIWDERVDGTNVSGQLY